MQEKVMCKGVNIIKEQQNNHKIIERFGLEGR